MNRHVQCNQAEAEVRPVGPLAASVPTRRFEGRALPRPDEDVVDQGLAFDIDTLFSRRRMLSLFGVGATAIGLAACSGDGGQSTASASQSSASQTPSAASPSSSASASATQAGTGSEIPDETAGPYPGDGSNGPDVLKQSGIVRSDIRSSFGTGSATAQGVPMTLELALADLANGGVPFAGTAVYVWHCDSAGQYSMYSSNVTQENYLRGVQIADADGKVRFTSIFPACYAGRWPHIHFEVYPDEASITDTSKAIATSQVALPKNVCDAVYAQAGYEQSVRNLSQISLQTDNVFGDDGGATQLATVTGDVGSGYTVTLPVRIDTRTTPTGGGVPGGDMGGGMGGGPGGNGGPGGMPPRA